MAEWLKAWTLDPKSPVRVPLVAGHFSFLSLEGVYSRLLISSNEAFSPHPSEGMKTVGSRGRGSDLVQMSLLVLMQSLATTMVNSKGAATQRINEQNEKEYYHYLHQCPILYCQG